MGLFDTVALFGAVILGAPIALLGVEFIVEGRLLAGVAFIAIGFGLVAGMYFRPSVKSIATDVLFGSGADADEETGR